MKKNHITDTLKNIFTHWTDKQVSDLVAHIFAKYGNLNKNDSDKVLDLLNIVIVKAINSYSVNKVLPGLIVEMLPQQLLKKRKEEAKKSQNEIPDNLEAYNDREIKHKDFSLEKYLEKLERFEQYAIRNCGFSPKEKDFFKFLMIVLKRDASPPLIKQNNSLPNNVEIWDELFEEIHSSGWQISDVYFRRLLSNIREKLRNKRVDITGEMLHLIPKEDEDLQEIKEFLIDQISLLPKSVMHLNAYRFSEEELVKMIWLKKLFENNGYTFEPNRFPEVYYDDYDRVKKVFPFIESGQENTPDFLGMYLYCFEEGYLGKPCDKSKEGIIVLFRDRIENYCLRSSTSIDSVRFVVLMHELGHWLTHWALKGGKNWKYGYNLYPQTRRTHEALAQLIAYWASEDSKANLDTLTLLSPKDASGKIDSSKIYGGYVELTSFSKVSMLDKLAEIRDFWILKDEFMLSFLKSKNDSIEDWVKQQLKNKPDTVFVEEILKDAIYGDKDCAESFKEGLNLKKLIEISILNIEWLNLEQSIL